MARLARFIPKPKLLMTIDLGCQPWSMIHRFKNDIITKTLEIAKDKGYTVTEIHVKSLRPCCRETCTKKHCITYKVVEVYGFDTF